jgi:hypothetical protein
MHHSAQQPFFKALIFYVDGVFADSDPKSLPQSLLAVFPSTAVFKTQACGVPPWGVRYIHYNGLYSSRCKARWQRWPHLARCLSLSMGQTDCQGVRDRSLGRRLSAKRTARARCSVPGAGPR